MPAKVIFFNGPPRSGKDTAARELVETLDDGITSIVHFDRFAYPLKAAFAAVMRAYISSYHDVSYYELHKEEVVPELGVSFRQFQKDFSEKFMKPLYGNDVFGRLLIQRQSHLESGDLLVIPDSGFTSEVLPVAERFGLENILLVRIHREGCDFSNDTRSYLRGVVSNEVDVHNSGTQSEFQDSIIRIAASFLNGWTES